MVLVVAPVLWGTPLVGLPLPLPLAPAPLDADGVPLPTLPEEPPDEVAGVVGPPASPAPGPAAGPPPHAANQSSAETVRQ